MIRIIEGPDGIRLVQAIVLEVTAEQVKNLNNPRGAAWEETVQVTEQQLRDEAAQDFEDPSFRKILREVVSRLVVEKLRQLLHIKKPLSGAARQRLYRERQKQGSGGRVTVTAFSSPSVGDDGHSTTLNVTQIVKAVESSVTRVVESKPAPVTPEPQVTRSQVDAIVAEHARRDVEERAKLIAALAPKEKPAETTTMSPADFMQLPDSEHTGAEPPTEPSTLVETRAAEIETVAEPLLEEGALPSSARIPASDIPGLETCTTWHDDCKSEQPAVEQPTTQESAAPQPVHRQARPADDAGGHTNDPGFNQFFAKYRQRF